MRRDIILAGGLLLLLCLAGCRRGKMLELTTTESGLELSIRAFRGDMGHGKSARAMKAATERFRESVKTISRSGNPLDSLNLSRGPLQVPAAVYDLLSQSEKIRATTGGAWQPVADFEAEVAEVQGEEYEGEPPDVKVELLPENRVKLSGKGELDLLRLTVAWALDQAADQLAAAGIPAAMLSCGGACRMWGGNLVPEPWGVEVYGYNAADTTVYRVEPQAGGLARLESDDTELQLVLTWAPTAVQARALAEAALEMGHSGAMRWFSNRRDYGVVVRFTYEDGMALEADPVMSGWISTVNP